MLELPEPMLTATSSTLMPIPATSLQPDAGIRSPTPAATLTPPVLEELHPKVPNPNSEQPRT